MVKLDTQFNKGNITNIHIFLFVITILAGLMNSADYFHFIGLSNVFTLIKIFYYLLVSLLFFLLLINNLLIRNTILLTNFSYWFLPLFAVLLKFLILFLQNPYWLMPKGKFFPDVVDFILNFSILILIASLASSYEGIKVTIWGLGLGAAFSALIPFLMFPEMIGSRPINVQGYEFTGGFWNSAVISYISIGWLLFALSTLERSKFIRFFLISLFLIIAFGGIAGLSRATLLSVIVSVCIYLLFAKKIRQYLKVILISVIITALVINLFPEVLINFGERLDGGLNIEEEPRTDIWLDYFEDLPEYMFFGALDGNYKKYSVREMGPHSVILNWLVQYGILGLVGFIILIIGLIKSINSVREFHSRETYASLYAWLGSYLSVAIINETGFKQLTVFAAFGIILAWGNYVNKYKSI